MYSFTETVIEVLFIIGLVLTLLGMGGLLIIGYNDYQYLNGARQAFSDTISCTNNNK